MQKNNVKNKPSIVSGAIWSVLDNTAAQAITFVIFIVLARILTPKVYGMLSVSLLVTQFFRSVIFDSIATSIVRMKEPTEMDYNSALFLCFIFSLPAFIIVFFAAPYIEHYLNVDKLANVIRGTAIIILVAGLSRIHEAWLTHNLMFKQLAIRSITSISIGGIVGITLAFNGFAITSLVAQQVTTSLISGIALWVVTPWKPKLSISLSSIKESSSYSKHVALSGITNFANQNSDVFFITYFLGASSAGIYSAGKRIVNTLNLVLASALMRVSLPAFSMHKNNLDEFQRVYLRATYFTVLLTAPAFIGLTVLSHDITYLLLGEKWLSSVVVMQIVSAVGFITSIGYYNHSVMFARDKPEWQSRLTLVYAISNLLAFYIFVRYGLTATALAFSLRTLLLYPISAWCALTLLDIPYKKYISELMIPILCSVIMSAFILFFQMYIYGNTSWIALISKIFIGVLVYTAFILLLTSKERKKVIFQLFGRVISRK